MHKMPAYMHIYVQCVLGAAHVCLGSSSANMQLKKLTHVGENTLTCK